jgi:uncharacterized protein (DUF342 family)
MRELKQKVKPEQVVKILKDYGINMTIKEAEMILEFARKFAKLTVEMVRNKVARGEKPSVKTPRKIFSIPAVSKEKYKF